MNKFYVRDRKQIKYFDSVPEVVAFLELVVKEKQKMNRAEWMQHCIDLGGNPDDRFGKNFVESMAELVEIGTVQKTGQHVRCNIFEATVYSDPAYGN